MSKSQKRSDEQEFEKRLFYSLKRFGYLFPENEKDVEGFEHLYGDTDIDIPEHLQNMETINIEEEIPLDFDVNYKMAAFSNGNLDQFDFPENSEEDDSDKD